MNFWLRFILLWPALAVMFFAGYMLGLRNGQRMRGTKP